MLEKRILKVLRVLTFYNSESTLLPTHIPSWLNSQTSTPSPPTQLAQHKRHQMRMNNQWTPATALSELPRAAGTSLSESSIWLQIQSPSLELVAGSLFFQVDFPGTRPVPPGPALVPSPCLLGHSQTQPLVHTTTVLGPLLMHLVAAPCPGHLRPVSGDPHLIKSALSSPPGTLVLITGVDLRKVWGGEGGSSCLGNPREREGVEIRLGPEFWVDSEMQVRVMS